jgi:Concanavalin A-like lectin/glucanases superfamily
MTTIIQGTTIQGFNVYDASFNSTGALLYLDAGNTASYSGSGTTWYDLSTNTNNATLAGSPPFTSSGSASYFSFNGAGTQYAGTPTAKYNQTYTGKTVFVAAKLTSIATSTFRCLFGTPTGTRNFNTYIYCTAGGAYQIHFSAGPYGGFSTNLALSLNTWFVVAVTMTTGGVVTYYFNGQPAGTDSGTFAQWVSNGNENVAYGDNYWYGAIPVVAVYGRALTADQIQQNFNAIRGRYGL